MKKAFLLAVVVGLAVFTVYRLATHGSDSTASPKTAPLAVSKNSGNFNAAFETVLNDYFKVCADLVDWDSIHVDSAAKGLSAHLAALPLDSMKADPTAVETARSFIQSMDGDLHGLTGEKHIDEKRKELNILSEELYDLVRTVRYDGQTIYKIKCPMAFGDSAEGYWLTNQSRIINPYLGKYHPMYKSKMLECGEKVDSLNFAFHP